MEEKHIGRSVLEAINRKTYKGKGRPRKKDYEPLFNVQLRKNNIMNLKSN